jgi:signal transduction histidine kinase/DNA-binding response OmpR family regulator
MFLKQFRFLAFWTFIIGLMAIVFLQFISTQNINRLIKGNNNLLNELTVQKNIRDLQSKILALESDIRGAVISNDSFYLSNVNNSFLSIQRDLQSVQSLLQSKDTDTELLHLNVLVTAKLRFTNEILQTLRRDGAIAAQNVIRSNRGQILRDSIINLVGQIDNKRQKQLRSIINSTEHSGTQAKRWGIVLGIFACFFIVIAFYQILKQARQQQQMIDALNESERRTREAARLKEQFVANMSHEIRTPMNAILGFTSLLRKTQLSEEQRQYTQSIHSASENLLVLINDILDLSKIEAGMMNLEQTKFSLRSLVASVAAMFSERVKEKKLHFFTHVDDEIPDILSGDALRLTQILVNILSNAVKFTDKGNINFSVTQLQQYNDQVHLQFVVKDTGIGIAKEKLSSVFDRFQQAESSTSRRYGGTGLGLAIVRQLVDLQHGKLHLHSEEGKGTEFKIELPYEVIHETTLANEMPVSELLRSDLKDVKVLIAEDNQMNQQLIHHLMKIWGIEYTIVATGAEAIEELKKNGYSLVLMDIQMPEMDGYTATEYIRKEIDADIPIIAMTAHAMAGEKERCLQAGMSDYISKPLKESALYNLILFHVQLSFAMHKEDTQVMNMQTGYSIINLSYLHELSGNDLVFEREMLHQFLLQTPGELNNLQQAIEAGEFLNIKKIAHGFKSTVGYLGLSEQLYPYLDRIEENAANEQKDNIDADFRHVRTVCEQAMEEVKELLSGNRMVS